MSGQQVRALALGLASVLVSGCAGAGGSPAAVAVDPGPALSSEPERAAPAERDRTDLPTPEPTEQIAPTPAPSVLVVPAMPNKRKQPALAEEPVRWDGIPVPADDPATVLKQLVTAERAIRDPAVGPAELAWMGHLQQLLYRRLLERPAWRDQVFAGIPEDLRAAADLTLAAFADLRPSGPVRTTKIPAWRIVAPRPIAELLTDYREAEASFGVPWYYLAAINLVETRMGRIRGTSYAGAQGPMQFMPATWDAYGHGDINDDHDAILAAARYLKASGAPSNMPRAVYAYNHDNSYVDAVTKYAEVMRRDPNAYRGYYGWQVYFITSAGEVLLPVGYPD